MGLLTLIFGSCLCWFHTKNTHGLFQHRCFQSRWFEGGTEAGPRFCKSQGRDGEHRAQPSLCSSHLILFSSNGMKKNLYFVKPFPCLHPLAWKAGLCLHATAFLMENLKFPQWKLSTVLLSAWISKIYQCPYYSPSSTLSKDFRYYQGHATWAPT